MYKYEAIKADALWVIRNYGSNAGEKTRPGSKAAAQAARIAEFARQWDETVNFLDRNQFDLINLSCRR